MIEVGKINNLKVNRKTDIGYLLEDEEKNSVVLHFNDADNQEVLPNTNLDVYIYLDSKNRPSASLQKPLITLGEEGLLKVVSVSALGVFVANGIKKDVLINRKYLKMPDSQWPIAGDYVLCVLKYDGYLYGVPLMEPHQEQLKTLSVGDQVAGYVTKLDPAGIRIATFDRNIIFIHKSNTRGEHRLGECIEATITAITPQNTYLGKTIANKEIALVDDASTLISYLMRNNYVMDLDASSSSEAVMAILKISRKAFKRALGSLYKRGLVTFQDGKTYLKQGA
ncbi:MAG: hypothetical protein LBV55_03850 [Acholeplasmatales bacterium]|jgi:predicted RNA-binding protein (virulence factor B family)|nr:hypothetical protein [Acholeplasmatales bacterium]